MLLLLGGYLQRDVASEAVLAQPPPNSVHNNSTQLLLLGSSHFLADVCNARQR